ncbi:MAG: SusC/RagA family TonB-linked outer membrane protein [Bacteroidota bacterium]|nr:SusC/RagA family TonB-linked outer membrane protein [Bacteroidota bacterium]
MRKFLIFFISLMLSGVLAFSQTRVISGTVKDEAGKPVSAATVQVKGTKIGTITNDNGSFSLSIPSGAKQVVFSFLGYKSQTINISSSETYFITLLPSDVTNLDEVVITGISNTKKSEYTGATTKLIAKEIENKPVGSFDQLLQGRVPGLLALTTSGQPGNNSAIIIRGEGSIAGGSDPLYVVDGIPVETAVFQNLNPNDFASVDILRDAASAALYGSRGSAGVIVITTKRGVAGKMKLSYDGQLGIKYKPDFAFKPMTTTQLLKTQEEYGKIIGSTASTQTLPGWYYSKLNPRYATLTPDQQANTDHILDSISQINTNWSDAIFRQGSFNNHQLSLSGGTGKTRIYSSVALYNEQGTTLRTDMNRVTLRNNLDYSDDKFTMALSTNLGYTKRDFQQSSDFDTGNPFATSAFAVPYQKLYNPDGSYATGTGTQYVATDQLDITRYDRNYNNQLKATIGFTAGYKITKEITLSLTSGIDFRETQSSNYGSPLAYIRLSSTSVRGHAGFQSEGIDRFFTGDVRPSVTYKKAFDKSELEVTAVGEYIKEMAKNFNGTGYGIDPRTPNTIAAVTPGNAVNQLYQSVTGGKSTDALLSGLGMARYTYDGKYTISGSYRYDGSSKLPTATRWQGFYSVGAVWNAGKEGFMKNISAINVLNVKLSYGGSGDANNFPGGAYPYQATYAQGTYSGLNTIVSTYPGNPNMKWETTYVTNLGIDFGLFSNRIYGDINLYDKRTKDLFVEKKLSATAGFGNGGSLDINAGELQNKGVEVNLNIDVLRSKNFVWTVFANGAYNKNKVLSLGGEKSYEVGTGLVTVGKPLGSLYDVKWGGVDAATGAPLYYTKDGVLTTTYSADNAVQDYGTWEAPWNGGFGSDLHYKGFDFSALFSWQQGAVKADNLQYFTENLGFMSSGYNQSSDLNFWQKPGDIASTPSPLYGTNFSSNLFHDASFLRLRDVTLSYSIPENILNKTKFISKARFYVQGTNLFIWTKWRGRDPEAGAVNINVDEYPNPRAMTLGFQVTF